MRVGQLRWVLRQSGVLGDADGEPAPAELADALWLAALRREGRSRPAAADEAPPALHGLGESQDAGVAPEPVPDSWPEPPPPVPVPPSADPLPAPDEVRPDPQVYATVPVRGRPSPGVLVSAAARPQLPDPLPLARAMRPLRRRVPSATRWVLDEDKTASACAEQQLWLPALVPDRELAFDLALVLDDSESMALWGEKLREFRVLCERMGAFRDVRVWRLGASGDGGLGRPVLRGLSRSSGARDERELLDPSGRRLILVVTDGVHPGWQPSGPLRPVLARWALASPLAIVQPFPQRLWDKSPLRAVMKEFRPGWPGSGPTVRQPANGHPGGQRSLGAVAVPILELSPAAMRRWARVISGTSGRTPLPAAILPRDPAAVGQPGDVQDGHGDTTDPGQLVRDFRAAASPAAYQLAGYLSAAPLTLPVMRLVQESMMPATGPAELAEVFLSGLVLRATDSAPLADPQAASYVFAAGVRDVLQSMLTRGEALSVLDQVGGYLVRGRRGGRPFPVLLQGRPDSADIQAAADQFPATFGRISSLLLERIGGQYADAYRELADSTAADEIAEPIEEALPTEEPESDEEAESVEDAELVAEVALTEELDAVEEPEAAAPSVPERRASEREGWAYDPTGLFSGKLYQPMLFVGLGGTGCDIGAELERRLRDAICGPDGNDFRRHRGREAMLPYQLPSCIQFLYADMNQAELERLPRRVVPGPEHVPASALTARYVPTEDFGVASYPELARQLRLQVPEVVQGWLPPATRDEPKVNPLHRGAGQFPTIGRATLMSTFINGVPRALRDIRDTVGKLATSGEDLQAMGGRPPRAVDVFVAFSVAGGTGAGIFYDYLHLIADTIEHSSGMQVKLYPLVVMPSAFADGLGGGRPAQLNAGRALLDLFRLVDEQNRASAQRMLRGASDRPASDEDLAVSLPAYSRIVMRPGTMQTGFLFSRPAGASRDDMHRSIASLVLSLTGTELPQDDNAAAEHHQSWADSLVSQSAIRQAPPDNGMGGRGVSTALVASLTVPSDELADLVGGRLLRMAIESMATPDAGQESTRSHMEEYLVKSGIHPVLTRHGSNFAEPAPVSGAREISAALNYRRDAMRAGIEALRTKLSTEMPQLVARFDPASAVHDMLGELDIFRLQRVVAGHAALRDEVERGGIQGFVNARRAAPPPPQPGWAAPPPPLAGWAAVPPAVPELRDRPFRRCQWMDAAPLDARNTQNAWYDWQTKVQWAQAWDPFTPQWRRPLDRMLLDVDRLTKALADFARANADDFPRRSAELYRRRVGMSYLLPGEAGGMDRFYDQLLRRLRSQLASDETIAANASEADLLRAMLGSGAWAEAFRISVDQSPENAVARLRERVRTAVKLFLRVPSPGEQPILPRLHDLLAEAAAEERDPRPAAGSDYLESFRAKLAGLLPANFVPQGNGPLRVLITYPADAGNRVVEGYLKSVLFLPSGPGITQEFRCSQAESISVLMLRTAMGVTEVEEVRDVLRLWAAAQASSQPTDLLRWRQRTGYDVSYLLTRERDRVEILHRILCALWNGKAVIAGPTASPERLHVTFGNSTMTLSLTGFGQASSWASLLRAYELWALEHDGSHRLFCRQLLRELPRGVDGRPAAPSALYSDVRQLADTQIPILDQMTRDQQPRAAQMRSFWDTTLPDALDLEFTGVEAPAARNLRELEEQAEPSSPATRRVPPNPGRARQPAWAWSLADDPEAIRHWRPRSRGMRINSERGYRFRGRTAALRAIVKWLDRKTIDRRVLVVTGAPGSGKSAVLGRIVTTADASAAAGLPASDAAVRATIGSVACAVRARGKTALDIAKEIARAARAPLPERLEDFAPALHDALSGRPGSRFNVIIDALDEAASPGEARGIIASVILPMVQTCADVGAQAVVGTRSSDADGDLLRAFRRAAVVVDLNTQAFFDFEDLTAYTLAMLQLAGDERPGNPYTDDEVATPAARRIATLADGNFLKAGLTARTRGLYDEKPANPATISLDD
jgi:hypothetical protein